MHVLHVRAPACGEPFSCQKAFGDDETSSHTGERVSLLASCEEMAIGTVAAIVIGCYRGNWAPGSTADQTAN